MQRKEETKKRRKYRYQCLLNRYFTKIYKKLALFVLHASSISHNLIDKEQSEQFNNKFNHLLYIAVNIKNHYIKIIN